LVSLGDGSTLTLDFTTGLLDPRLSFERLSPATFINSSGLVAWAAANMITRNQSQDSNTYWSAFGTEVTRTASQSDPLGGTGAVKLDYNATSADAVISRTVSVQQGLQYTISVWLRADSGTVNNVRFGRGASAAGAYFPSLTTTWQRFSLTFTATGGSDGIELRVLNSGTPKTASFHVFGAQLEPGDTMRDYNPALLDVPYHAPRFDHDPTTLAPRGLLIEGQATNLITYSNEFSNAAWLLDNSGATNPSVSTVSQTGPDGAATVTRITFNKTGGTFSRIRNTASGTASQPYTMSVWMKTNTASGGAATQNVGLRIGADPAGFNCVVTTTWKRFQYTYTLSGTDANAQIILWDNIVGNDETADVLVYGCQMEAGSSASSYIPTGASTATRAADSCVMTGTNFSSWFIAGSPYSMLFKYSLNNPSAFAGASVDRAAGTLSVSGGGNRTFIHAAYRTTSGSGDEGRFVRVFDTGSLDLFPATLPAAASNTRLAFAVDTNNAGVSAANQSLGTDSGCTILTGQNQLELGKVGSSQFINGCISLVKYWPTRLPNATLQALTT
jgi:hypothetical protein